MAIYLKGDVRVVPDEMTLLVVCDVVATLGLVDADLTLGSHIYISQLPTQLKTGEGEADVQWKY